MSESEEKKSSYNCTRYASLTGTEMRKVSLLWGHNVLSPQSIVRTFYVQRHVKGLSDSPKPRKHLSSLGRDSTCEGHRVISTDSVAGRTPRTILISLSLSLVLILLCLSLSPMIFYSLSYKTQSNYCDSVLLLIYKLYFVFYQVDYNPTV